MRLSEFDLHTIIKAVHDLDSLAEVYLYGSRLDDSKRGGDIDVLVVSSKLSAVDKISILVEIKSQLGEQKLDLSIKSRDQISGDAFFAGVLRGAKKIG